jgi:3-phenylpropionate/trans-cinnamate dioxygenase ferredoxin subunit
MSEAATAWQPVAALADLPDEGLHEVAVGRHLLLLVRREGEVLAVQGLCPHQFAPLVEGVLDAGGWLHCPRHRACFRLSDGACGPGWVLPPLKRYAVRLEDGMVLLPDPLLPDPLVPLS